MCERCNDTGMIPWDVSEDGEIFMEDCSCELPDPPVWDQGDNPLWLEDE
jgi:hypothetical protein